MNIAMSNNSAAPFQGRGKLPFILEKITPAPIAAYSLRKLRNSYAGAAVRVRESTGNTERDIGFVGHDLDITVYRAFVGAGTGYVTKFYNQGSGGTNLDLVQATQSNQPELILNAQNSRPALKFVPNNWLDASSAFSSALTQPVTTFLVSRYDGTQGAAATGIFYTGTDSNRRLATFKRNTNLWAINGGTVIPTVEPNNNNIFNIFTTFFNGGSSALRVNGRNAVGGNAGAFDWTKIRMGADAGVTPGNYLTGTIAELIVYASDVFSTGTPNTNSVIIQKDQATYFRIGMLARQGASTLIADSSTIEYSQASIKRLSSGVLVLSYAGWNTANTPLPKGMVLHIRFSQNNGTTWTAEDKYLDGSSVTNFPATPGTLSANQGAGEPWLYLAPNGDLLIHMWKADYAADNHGSWQMRSTDGGKTWSSATQITFLNLPPGDTHQDWIYSTDDDFVYNGVIYAGARILEANDSSGPSIERNVFIKSTDNGTTWEYVSDLSSFSSAGGFGTIEVGLEYLGNNKIVAVLRPQKGLTTGWITTSTDMGLTWPALTEITTMTLGTGRPRIYTVSHLRGKENWWNDPRLVMNGFVTTTGEVRRNCLWISYDQGVTWTYPLWVDVSGGQGYGDMFYDPDNDEFVYISTFVNGSSRKNIKQFRAQLNGL